MRGRLREQQTYAQAVSPRRSHDRRNGRKRGQASADPRFVAGDIVVGARDWQTHSVTPGDRLTKLDRHGAPLSASLGPLGNFWAQLPFRGVTEILQPEAG